jgi:hypothetical protein
MEQTMRLPTLMTVCLLLAATLATAQDARNQGLRSQETAAGVIQLPTRLPGTVAYPTCDTCETRQYSIDEHTEFFIGESSVSLDQMRAEIAARPRALAMVAITADLRGIRKIFIVPLRSGE